jgi:hypothetical protein
MDLQILVGRAKVTPASAAAVTKRRFSLVAERTVAPAVAAICARLNHALRT